jgi:DNA processing protein
VPASPGDPRGGGCLKLLRMGAELCAAPEDVLDALARRDGPLLPPALARAPVRERPARVRRTPASAPRAHARVAKPEGERASTDSPSAPTASTGALDDASRVVYDSLSAEGRHIDEIAMATGLAPARVRAALLTLVLIGLAADRGDGTFLRSG